MIATLLIIHTTLSYNMAFKDNAAGTGDVSPGFHHTVWLDTTAGLSFEHLEADVDTHVVVIGAGMAGLSVAYNLACNGIPVVVVDNGHIGSGESGRTTAHLVNALDDRYSELVFLFGEENARLAAESHTAAIDFIEDTVKREYIDCDFVRLPGYLMLHPTDRLKTLEDEFVMTQRLGIHTELLPRVPGIPDVGGPCLLFAHQAQFHPLKYLQALALAIQSRGGRIYNDTHVDEIGPDYIKANGHILKAKHTVVATNSPINNRFTLHTKQFAYRSYVIGAVIPRDSVPMALWWDTGDQDAVWLAKPYHYVRTQRLDDKHDLLICGGEDHKLGQAGREHIDEEDRYDRLEQWLRQRFPMIDSIRYVWSGQILEPVDALGFIGRNPGDEHIYVVTGDSGNGMTHSTIAGMLLSDLIQGKSNPWEKVYDPARVTLRATGDYIREVSGMVLQYLDYLTPGERANIQDIRPGDGAVIRAGIHKLAVYHSAEGQWHACDATCPHLGCYVRWNNDEKSFDCPCHGSRFTAWGKVVNGPALSGLKPVAWENIISLTKTK